MGRQQLGQLAERYRTDAEFRARFQADPNEAMDSSGIELSEDDRAHVNSVDVGNMTHEDAAHAIANHDA